MTLFQIIKKYKDVVLYLFFGVCTTMVNVVVYWLMAYMFRAGMILSTVIAWLCAVLFAYITNRKWVFHSEMQILKDILKELLVFLFCRMATGVVDVLCMLIFVDILKMNDIIIKFVSNVLVIALNYIASKWMIFRKRGRQN